VKHKHEPQNKRCNVGFEVATAVVMKSTIFWDIPPSSLLKVNRRFGGTYRLHLQGQRTSLARNQRESRWEAEPSRWYSSRDVMFHAKGLKAHEVT
jgi:hypothetical protein